MTQKIFFDYLYEYADFLDEMILTEKEKLSALVSNDLIRIEHSITTQQAIAKQFENMERKRLVLQNDAGMQDLTFSEIIAKVELEQQKKLKNIFNRIQQSIEQIKYLNTKSMDVVKTNMSLNNSMVDHQMNQPLGYSKDQLGTNTARASLLEKKV